MRQVLELDQGWEFRRLGPNLATEWTLVALPHSPFVSDLNGQEHWFGECEYRRTVEVPQLAPGETCTLYVGAAMHTAHVFVGDQPVARNEGGYLPFEADLTPHLKECRSVVLTLRLDNRDNPDVPPGKPSDELDFCWYGGLYRNVELRVAPVVHLTDAATTSEVAGGGVFLRTLEASAASALVAARSHVRNTGSSGKNIRVETTFRHEASPVVSLVSDSFQIPAHSALHIGQALTLDRPCLWSPQAPSLYQVTTRVLDESGEVLDSLQQPFGVRRIQFSRSGGFVINGQRKRLRGTNRHQEYPRVGYAAPRVAQYRDARRIKEAGFDYVRLSHYPQSSEFLDACDELGIIVMNCIPGWQYVGGPRFRASCCDAARRLIRRDRNHPSIVLWELSLNESAMDEEFILGLQRIGHEEYPGDQMFTCGWIDRYDVFSHSRQHGEIHRWLNKDKALVIAEYGDWEFYAKNDGFDQKTGAGVYDRWSTSRQFRSDGERGLRQQAFNHMMALNDTLGSPAALDSQWAMFDYARGYDPVRAAVGVMDIFRLPKFSYHFYRSQRDPEETGRGWSGGAMVFVATHWTTVSNLRIPVFSNCQEVELMLNGQVIGRQRPAQTALTQNLPHPPFFFDVPTFQPGTLEAIGYIQRKIRARHVVTTPDPPTQLEVLIDDAGIPSLPGESDLLFAHARWRDHAGTLCIDATTPVTFTIQGAAEIVGESIVSAEAGIASIVVRVPASAGGLQLSAAGGSTHAVNVHWHRSTVAATAAPLVVAL
ncbi:MAG: glycoside hydrolase family 2 TIM barrel-domain containing protein [Opitutus sp.]